MLIEFSKHFKLPVAEVYSYFETPADWTRLFGFAENPTALGGGWYAVGLPGFRFPLVAKNIEQERNRMVRWVFKGFWRGRGEVRFTETEDGVTVEGFERISVRWLFFLSPLYERRSLERGFRALWTVGWRRLSKIKRSDGAGSP